MTNRRIVLAQRPSGMVDEATTRLGARPRARARARDRPWSSVRYLSMDPTIRTWMDDAPGYLPPIGLGETVRGGGVGEVVRSNSDRYCGRRPRGRDDGVAGLRRRRRRRRLHAGHPAGDRPDRWC